MNARTRQPLAAGEPEPVSWSAHGFLACEVVATASWFRVVCSAMGWMRWRRWLPGGGCCCCCCARADPSLPSVPSPPSHPAHSRTDVRNATIARGRRLSSALAYGNNAVRRTVCILINHNREMLHPPSVSLLLLLSIASTSRSPPPGSRLSRLHAHVHNLAQCRLEVGCSLLSRG